MKQVYVERALGLGIGFLNKPENLELPETKALLKIIDVFPWMVNVADHNYNPEFAKRALVYDALNKGLVDKLLEKF